MTTPTDVQALQAEVERLREMLSEALQGKDRALRLLRQLNADLSGQVQGRTRQLSSIYQLINQFNASLDLHEVATTALISLQTLVGVEAASLTLLDSRGEINFVMAQPVELMPALAQFRLKKGQGIVGRVIQAGQSYVTNDARKDPAFFPEVDRATGFETRSVLCEPLIIRNQVIGAVELLNKRAGPFADSDRAFVETVGGSMAIAVENARMYEEVQTQFKELNRTHAELVQTQAQLVRSAKLASIGELAAGLAHELNNPVGIILGFAQLMGQRAQDGKMKTHAALMERESMRIKRIVSDLLDFSRTATAEVTRVDLRQLIDQALSLVEYQLAVENIRVTKAYPDRPVWVQVDGDQFQQVLLNLIQNARQAMPEGGDLALRAWLEGAHSLFSISDTGVGIAESDMEHIFDPFFTTKPVGQGVGLGLSVSYGIITRHGGDIRVTSQPNTGATFTVRLPSAAEDD